MKTIKTIIKFTDNILTRWTTSCIHSVIETFYPKPHLDEGNKDDNDDEPILFI